MFQSWRFGTKATKTPPWPLELHALTKELGIPPRSGGVLDQDFLELDLMGRCESAYRLSKKRLSSYTNEDSSLLVRFRKAEKMLDDEGRESGL